ncbi:hypothetical protein B0H11DRAFT_2287036 [Mycena galericulata]|nr:hypothetical protein B0H11DRAFT_2287036 [Mycena galericulata]
MFVSRASLTLTTPLYAAGPVLAAQALSAAAPQKNMLPCASPDQRYGLDIQAFSRSEGLGPTVLVQSAPGTPPPAEDETEVSEEEVFVKEDGGGQEGVDRPKAEATAHNMQSKTVCMTVADFSGGALGPERAIQNQTRLHYQRTQEIAEPEMKWPQGFSSQRGTDSQDETLQRAMWYVFILQLCRCFHICDRAS